ncbi:putative DNA-binding transcriptional regulator YafY [Nakamurella sp. UYEF19]
MLVSWGRRWYLVGRDVDRTDWRTYLVDRMRLRTPNGPRFMPRELPEKDVAAYVSQRISSASWRFYARIAVHAPAAVITDRIDPTVGTVKPLGTDRCVLSTGADHLETHAVYLGMLGQDFTVTEPPELIDHLRLLADRYAKVDPGSDVSGSEYDVTVPDYRER